MAPTLRSDRQEGNQEETHPTSPQVMSPIRAQHANDVASSVQDSKEESNEEDSGFPDNSSDRRDSTMSHSDVEHLARSLAEIPGGRRLIQALLQGLAQSAERAEENPPPQRPRSNSSVSGRNRHADDAVSVRSDAPSNVPSMFDNKNPGGRYDDAELTDSIKSLRNVSIKLPALTKKEEYQAWYSEVPLHFESCMLGDITYGAERFDSVEGYRRPKYAEWYKLRQTKAFSAMALSLSVELRTTFKIDDMRDQTEAASILWKSITDYFEAGDGVNPDYLRCELMMRKLKPNEAVTNYIKDIDLKARKLRQARGSFEEWEHASLLISNSLLAFPEMARAHSVWIANNDPRSMTLAEALQRLRSAEHSSNQVQQQSTMATSRPATQVAQVNNVGQGQGGQNRKRNKNAKKKKRATEIAKKKQKFNCANCGGDGHWYAECEATTGIELKPELVQQLQKRKKQQQQQQQGKKPPSSLVTSVGVQVLPLNSSKPVIGTEDADCGSVAATLSPVYSPTSPASDSIQVEASGPGRERSVEASGRGSGRVVTRVRVPTTPQQLQLQPPASLQRMQPVQQNTMMNAVQRQWEGTRQEGTPLSWERALYYLGQGLRSKPWCDQGRSRGGLHALEDGLTSSQFEQNDRYEPASSDQFGYGRRMDPYEMGRRGLYPDRNNSWPEPGYLPSREYGPRAPMQQDRGRSRSPPRGRSRSMTRDGFRSPPRVRSGRYYSPPRNGSQFSFQRGERAFSPPRRPPASHYGPQPSRCPPNLPRRADEPLRGRGLQPRDDVYRGRNDSPRRGNSPRRFNGRQHAGDCTRRDGPRMVNAVERNVNTLTDAGDCIEWILDSGSQANICGDLSLFTTLREDKASRLDFANGTSEHTTVSGSVLLRIVNEATGELEDRLLDDVVYSPNAKVNLISMGYLQTTGGYRFSVSPDQKTGWMSKPSTVLKFVMRDSIYRLRAEKTTGVMVMATAKQAVDEKKYMALLHQRFGHMNMHQLNNLASKIDVGVKFNTKNLSSYDCVACIVSKAKSMHHARLPAQTSRPLDILVMDICALNEATVSGATMFLFVIDVATRYKWAYLLSKKGEATWFILKLLRELKTHYKARPVLHLRTDQGGEFSSNELFNYCVDNGIVQKFTNSYSPQENGIAERANGVVLPRIRAMLTATHLPNMLWGEALLHIVETLNMLPTKALGVVSPYERFHKKLPPMASLRTWGCIAHVWIPPESRQRKEKLEPRARMCLLLGFSDNTKGYKFLDLTTCQVTTAQGGNVRFHEEFTADGNYVKQLLENGFKDGDHELPRRPPVVRIKTSMDTYVMEQDKSEPTCTAAELQEVTLVSDAESKTASSGSLHADTTVLSTAEEKHGDMQVALQSADTQTEPEQTPAASVKVNRKRTRRARKKLVEEKETTGFEIQPPPVEPCSKRPRRRTKPNVRLRDYVVGHVQATSSDINIPTTYKQAKASKYWPQWRAAMLAELQSLKDHGTWRLVPRGVAKRAKVITCRWVFAVKRDERGRVKRFKARLVIHGFKQQFGINYSETYAPVIRFETIRAVIYFAVQRDWEVLQYDVKTAFLYGDLNDEIYMEQPPGFQTDGPAVICRLLKSLYGLKQAPNIWNKTLHAKLMTMGFERTDSDYGLYLLKKNDEVKLLLTVYVDDLLLLGPRDLCAKIAARLQETFELTTMGTVKYLLGVEIQINRPLRQIIYSQNQYVLEVLRRFHMGDCNGCTTPEATTPSRANIPATSDYLPYRELVGALQYLVRASRPDIAHASRHLGKFLASYDHTHFAEAKRVLRYLKATCDYGLVMNVQSKEGVRISCYSDADYANDPVDRRSISGYVSMLDGNVISYASRKQEINAQSTCEAEYVAMAEATKDLLWLAGLCKELSWQHPVPLLLGDNQGAISLTTKPGKHSKSKHVDNKYHLVRRSVELKHLTTQHIGTEEMVADIMTKALAVVKFRHFRKAMKVVPIVQAEDDVGATTNDMDETTTSTTTTDAARR